MNTLELHDLMKSDLLISKKMGGVISSDHLKTVSPNEEKVYVVNTMPSDHPGLHWVALYVNVEQNLLEFWDPLGASPQKYGEYFRMFFNNYDYVYNTKRIQGQEKTCGHFCVYYAYYRCRGYMMETIVNSFSSDTACNDFNVVNFVNNMK